MTANIAILDDISFWAKPNADVKIQPMYILTVLLLA